MSNYSVSEAGVAWRNVQGSSWRILVEPASSVIGIQRYTVDFNSSTMELLIKDGKCFLQ